MYTGYGHIPLPICYTINSDVSITRWQSLRIYLTFFSNIYDSLGYKIWRATVCFNNWKNTKQCKWYGEKKAKTKTKKLFFFLVVAAVVYTPVVFYKYVQMMLNITSYTQTHTHAYSHLLSQHKATYAITLLVTEIHWKRERESRERDRSQFYTRWIVNITYTFKSLYTLHTYSYIYNHTIVYECMYMCLCIHK